MGYNSGGCVVTAICYTEKVKVTDSEEAEFKN